MSDENYYDVTVWNSELASNDVGQVINEIIQDIKSRQTDVDVDSGGKPGAVIYIPPGDYHLYTQVVIDISYLKIMGSGHGFTSSSIRYNTPENDLINWHEIWLGGSRILVESEGAAFYISRDGDPRLSSIEFENFCIDGLSFIGDAGENSYLNNKTGIYFATPQDSCKVYHMGMVYLEHGIVTYGSDALSIHDNFIAECGSCIELRDNGEAGQGQASKITDNLIGAGYNGDSIYVKNFWGLLVTANNIFPRGASSVHFVNVANSQITSNRFHAFYPGMVVLEEVDSTDVNQQRCEKNLISANHFLRNSESWAPMQPYNNGLEDSFGVIHINASSNAIIANHFTIEPDNVAPIGGDLNAIVITGGMSNTVATNTFVSTLPFYSVMINELSERNTVLDSGTEEQVQMDFTKNAFRATPAIAFQ